MQIKVRVVGDTVEASTPYHAMFVEGAKNLGGKWDSDDKVWVFKGALEDAVRDLCDKLYGSRGDGKDELVDVILTCDRYITASRAPVTECGRTLAKATGRDSGARLGDGVALLSGMIGSGGSMKN